ncbi:MAG: RNHCP domain-containing protein [Parcubacteria group bacterium]|nr:RNHCP domain-containing protein [Parcubacteria group bacterium]
MDYPLPPHAKQFRRRIESFRCIVCGFMVVGDGYTNHCPKCLTSKHVDIFPGDRANPCQGIMVAQAALYRDQEWYLVHRCERCRTIKSNRVSPRDSEEAIRRVV